MVARQHHNDLPPGFVPVGNLGLLIGSEASRLLVPQSVWTALKAQETAIFAIEDVQAGPERGVVKAPAEQLPQANGADAQAGKTALAAKRMRQEKTGVQIFGIEARAKALDVLLGFHKDQQKRSKPMLDAAAAGDGIRTLPRIAPALHRLRAAQAEFENLQEPIAKLLVDLTLAAAMPPDEFRIRPILLAGGPGVGKTHFALQLANALGVPMQKWSAGNAQANWQLTGAASNWEQSQPGLVYDLLAKGKSAAPVFVLDEVDKISDRSTHPLTPVLLDLLEPTTARTFRDEYFQIEFDASRVIFVLTANDLDLVPAPLLSRVEVFEVPPPAPPQRLRIIQGEFARLRRKTRRRLELDAATAEALAERADLDLRQTLRLVTDAFAMALSERQAIVTIKLPPRQGRRAIGFTG